MHRNKLLPFAYYMAPAKESMADFNLTQDINTIQTNSGDLGVEPEGDRGDDFDASLFEEEDDAKSRSVPDTKGKGKKEGEQPEGDDTDDGDDDGDDGDDGDDDAGDDDTTTDEAVDKVEDEKDKAKEPAKADDKGKKTKPNRADKRVQQLLERTAALERQLAKQTGSEAMAASLADLETQSGVLEKEYHKALGEDPEKATTLMRQIRQIDRKIAQIEASAEAEATVSERFETRDLQAVINTIVEDHPELDKSSDDFDQEVVNEINAVFTGLIATSSSKAAAMQKAVRYVLGEATTETKPAVLGDIDKSEEVRDKRQKQGRTKTTDAMNRQPASLSNVGKANSGDVVNKIRSIKDVEKLSDDELAKLRGDDV
jgi:hypothetical protein